MKNPIEAYMDEPRSGLLLGSEPLEGPQDRHELKKADGDRRDQAGSLDKADSGDDDGTDEGDTGDDDSTDKLDSGDDDGKD